MRSTRTTSSLTGGLAVTAAAALAITGVPWTAQADSIAEQVGASNVTLYSQFNVGNQASVKNDGTDGTIHLEAGANATFSSLTFQYSNNGTDWIDIQTVNRNADGTFSYEWTPPSGSLGSTVSLRAGGTPTGGGAATYDVQGGVLLEAAGGASSTVNITDGSALGYFQQPYALPNNTTKYVVSGTTSATTGTVALSRRGGDGAAVGTVVNAPVSVATGATSGTFRAALDLDGYTYAGAAGGANQIVVGAEGGTDDVEPFSLYKQSIATVTATADKAQVPSGQSATVTVTVKDDQGAAIAGAEVRSSTGGGPAYTNASGVATLAQGEGTAYYYANADAAAAYSEGAGDKKSGDIAVTTFTPAETSLKPTSVDGAAFDVNENATGDISVQVVDQTGGNNAVAARQVRYYWVITPFAGGAAVRVPAEAASPNYSTALTDAGGKANITFPSGQPDGTYELFAGLQANLQGNGAIASSKVLTVKAGQAAITYADATPQQAAAGTSVPVAGKLALADGTALPGRAIALTYTPGTEAGTGASATGDSALVGANNAAVTSLTVTTGADGTFSATVKDPAETPQPREAGGDLDAATATTTGIGNAGATKNDQKIDFLSSVAAGALAIAAESPLDTTKTPGRPVSSTVKLTAADGTALANQTVTLTTDKGFFTPYAATAAALTADPAAAAGADAGAYKSLGQSIQVKTDANGVASFTLAIGRDTGFDDDGKVDATVTATVGTVTDTEVVDWTSADPYNGGEVSVELSPASVQESSVLPKAPVSDKVYFDVFTTDQFGNRVGGETVTLTDNVGNGDPSTPTATSDFQADGDFFLTSTVAQDATVTGSWTTETHKYSSATPPVSTLGSETVTDAAVVNWYAVDYAASTFSLTHSGEAIQPVGSTVTETYTAIDQNGEPISDLYVQFFRTGPDTQQDGEGIFDGLLGQDGKIEYVFQGSREGKATISVIGRDGGATGSTVPAAQKTDTVTFGSDTPVLEPITVKLSGANKANGDDKLTVVSPEAAGAEVTIYKIRNGKRVLLKTGTLNAATGRTVFTIKDNAKRAKTTYIAVVSATDTTQEGTSKRIKLK